MAERKKIDWEKIELDYRAGIKTLRQIADEHGVAHSAISKRAKRDDWSRDLTARKESRAVVVPQVVDEYEKQGFIYIIFFDDSAGDRFFKIGLSNNFISRVSSHQTSLPFEMKIACGYFVGNMRLEERELHSIFADKNIRGEWFNLNQDDLESIAKRALLV